MRRLWSTSMRLVVVLTVMVSTLWGLGPFVSAHTLATPVPPESGLYSLTVNVETDDGGLADGTMVTVRDAAGPEVASGLVQGGVFEAELPNGSYAIVVDGTSIGYSTIQQDTLIQDGDVTESVMLTRLETPQPDPTNGMLEVRNLHCSSLDEVSFNSGDLPGSCTTGAGTFAIYEREQTTAEYIELQVWESGYGTVELEPGTYDMVEQTSGEVYSFQLEAGETESVVVANPMTTIHILRLRPGTLDLSVFSCPDIEQVHFRSDAFTVVREGEPPEPACETDEGTLRVYSVGANANDYWRVDVEGTRSLQLMPGIYEVVEPESRASTFVSVQDADTVSVDALLPLNGQVVERSSVAIVNLHCESASDIGFDHYLGSNLERRRYIEETPDCVPSMATFTFSPDDGGDPDDVARIMVEGAGSISLEPGTYEVVAEESQARYQLDITDDEDAILVVSNPTPADEQAP